MSSGNRDTSILSIAMKRPNGKKMRVFAEWLVFTLENEAE
jgi:hypothetical protein